MPSLLPPDIPPEVSFVKKVFCPLLFAVLVSLFAVACTKSTQKYPQEQLNISVEAADHIVVVWTDHGTNSYSITPERDKELFCFLVDKFSTPFNYVREFNNEIGEDRDVSFYSGDMLIWCGMIDIGQEGRWILHNGCAYEANDPDWCFTREEFLSLMEAYAS